MASGRKIRAIDTCHMEEPTERPRRGQDELALELRPIRASGRSRGLKSEGLSISEVTGVGETQHH